MIFFFRFSQNCAVVELSMWAIRGGDRWCMVYGVKGMLCIEKVSRRAIGVMSISDSQWQYRYVRGIGSAIAEMRKIAHFAIMGKAKRVRSIFRNLEVSKSQDAGMMAGTRFQLKEAAQ